MPLSTIFQSYVGGKF